MMKSFRDQKIERQTKSDFREMQAIFMTLTPFLGS